MQEFTYQSKISTQTQTVDGWEIAMEMSRVLISKLPRVGSVEVGWGGVGGFCPKCWIKGVCVHGAMPEGCFI